MGIPLSWPHVQLTACMRTCTGCRPRVMALSSSTTSSQPKARARLGRVLGAAHPARGHEARHRPAALTPRRHARHAPTLTLTLTLTLAIGQLPSP
eukprot:scaffold74097_cov51-Phaeocystis_antarctica.AAC.2